MITLVKIKCDYCGKEIEKYIGYVNRAKEEGLRQFCDKKCAGLGRRSNETEEEKKLIKYFYDAFRAIVFEKKFKKQNAEYFRKDYAANPEKYRAQRKAGQEKHNEYCRQPEYKKWKQEYDKKYRAKKIYGKLWESAIALNELAKVVDNRQAKQDQKTINKTQNRKRYANKNTKRKELESCTMGLYQPS